jgi:hypothetical protein
MPNVNKKYEFVFNTRIAGIPCQIGVTHFHNQPRWGGCAHTCDSDVDYYGCHENMTCWTTEVGRLHGWSGS